MAVSRIKMFHLTRSKLFLSSKKHLQLNLKSSKRLFLYLKFCKDKKGHELKTVASVFKRVRLISSQPAKWSPRNLVSSQPYGVPPVVNFYPTQNWSPGKSLFRKCGKDVSVSGKSRVCLPQLLDQLLELTINGVSAFGTCAQSWQCHRFTIIVKMSENKFLLSPKRLTSFEIELKIIVSRSNASDNLVVVDLTRRSWDPWNCLDWLGSQLESKSTKAANWKLVGGFFHGNKMTSMMRKFKWTVRNRNFQIHSDPVLQKKKLINVFLLNCRRPLRAGRHRWRRCSCRRRWWRRWSCCSHRWCRRRCRRCRLRRKNVF